MESNRSSVVEEMAVEREAQRQPMTIANAISKAKYLRQFPETVMSEKQSHEVIDTLLKALEASPCYLKATLAGMPTFVLIASDISATKAVGDWCSRRIADGRNVAGDFQITEALAIAERMEAWRKAHAGTA